VVDTEVPDCPTDVLQLLNESLHPRDWGTSRGPRHALKVSGLSQLSPAQKQTWLEESRVEAILGSCRRSLRSVRSGVTCYISFASTLCWHLVMSRLFASSFMGGAIQPHGMQCLPPKIETLLSWSMLFRSEGTFSNYIGHLKTACLLCKHTTKVRPLIASCPWCMRAQQAFDDPALARAKWAIKKRNCFVPRPRMWIKRSGLVCPSLCVSMRM
jgi:hypothetical protein